MLHDFFPRFSPFFVTEKGIKRKKDRAGALVGYGRRLTFKRLWVRIPVPDTGWTFFPIYCCKNCNVCLKRPKINNKRGRELSIFKNRERKKERERGDVIVYRKGQQVEAKKYEEKRLRCASE